MQTIIPNGSEAAIDLMKSMLLYNPDNRPTALEALRHSYFSASIPVPRNIQEISPQPPQIMKPAEAVNFSRPKHEPKGEPRLTVLERIKKSKYCPGVICK